MGAIIYSYLQTPRLDRNWYPDVAVMPTVMISGDLVTIRNIRNTIYRSEDDYTVTYYDTTFDLTELDEVRFMVEPFSDYRGPAHTLLSFGFSGQYVSISIETRKEQWETYNPRYWLVNWYELMYVIASEQDVIALRANHRKDDVYLYPIRTTPDKMRALFVDMVTRAYELSQHPEFYHTITDNCTSSIRKHINKLREDPIPFDWSLILPYYSDRVAYELWLIDSDLPFDQTKQLYYINSIASQCLEDERFSLCVRQWLTDRIEAQ